MKRPVTFYSEGCKLVGDMYYPDDLQPGEKRAGIVLCHGYTGVKDLYSLIIRGSGTRHTFRHAQIRQELSCETVYTAFVRPLTELHGKSFYTLVQGHYVSKRQEAEYGNRPSPV